VGGGLGGLAAAHRLIELGGVEVTLFEGGDRLGGSVRTERVGGYLVEHGADMFITDKPWALGLCRRLGLEDELVPTDERYRGSLVLRDGQTLPVPEGFTLMAPTAIRPMLSTRIVGARAKARMAAELFVRRGNGGDESVASFVRRRFGSEVLERLVQPLVGGIYTGDPERLSLLATFPRFAAMERDRRSLLVSMLLQRNKADRQASGARYGLFTSPRGGMGQLVASLESRVREHATVELGTRVDGLEPLEGGRWRVTSSPSPRRGEGPGGGDIFDACILAAPAWAAMPLLAPFAPAIADALGRIPHASTAVVVTAHRLEDVAHRLDAFGLVVPHVERRNVLAVSFASRKLLGRAPEGCVLLRTFVGGALQPELYAESDERILALVKQELAAILGIRGRTELEMVLRHGRAMPQYEVGHLDLVAGIDTALARHPTLALSGNAYRGVGIPDVVHSGEQAAERVADALVANRD
jgi:protoporphyrinogen/coproporphyrinogen III oxidase